MRLASNNTAAIIFVTVLVMSTVQMIFMLAIFGQWARVLDQLAILVLIGVAVKLWNAAKKDAMLILKQQALVKELLEIADKQNVVMSEQTNIIKNIKNNGNTKKNG